MNQFLNILVILQCLSSHVILSLSLSHLLLRHLGVRLEQKWRQQAKLATTKCQFSVAQECLLQAQDYGGLLLLATASGSSHIMENLAEGTEK